MDEACMKQQERDKRKKKKKHLRRKSGSEVRSRAMRGDVGVAGTESRENHAKK
jgi:hypothetical protein